MNIGIPVGGFHEGNTSEYVLRALAQLGHQAKILNQSELNESAASDRFDAYLCVDSGETLQFTALPPEKLCRIAFWYIDYRHNKNRPTRVPPDESNARLLSDNGGWIFQAQFQDADDCIRNGIARTSWLPMAADPEIWSPVPDAPKKFDVSFVGNIWDEGRLDAIRRIQSENFRFAALCNGAVWKEKAASAIQAGQLGFNVSSWYGTEFAFDLNMRFFEVLSCGVPIVTNAIPALGRLFTTAPKFVRVYDDVDEIVPTLRAALGDTEFLSSGGAARDWVLSCGTYVHRMTDALEILKAKLNVG